jgi:hypothetical protein
MMDLCPDAANQQSSKLDEFVMISRRIKKAGRNAHASPPTGRKNPPTANGSFDFASPEPREAPSKPIFTSSEETIGNKGTIASSDQAFSNAP